MFGAKYQWILAGKYSDDWWRTTQESVTAAVAAEAEDEMREESGDYENGRRCSEDTLRVVLNGYICADIMVLSLLQKPTIAKMVRVCTTYLHCRQHLIVVSKAGRTYEKLKYNIFYLSRAPTTMCYFSVWHA